MGRKQQIDWVTMGPAPHFATCQRCGDHIPPPKLPMPITAFVKYGEYGVELHRHCVEKPKDQVPQGKDAVTLKPSDGATKSRRSAKRSEQHL